MKDTLSFIFPREGDCLNANDGRTVGDTLTVTALVSAPEGHAVEICGVSAEYSEGLWRADVSVNGFRSTLVARDLTDGSETGITVLRFADPVGKFRLSSDDNILFLQDITANKDKYTSIFDNPYLALYKKAHDRFGAKVHLNLFYEFIPNERDYPQGTRGYFNLSMMTDKFRDEFAANSDWLKLAFHANSEYPDKPYRDAAGGCIASDFDKVCREIIRFAGEGSVSDTTTVHWGEGNRDCIRALRLKGLRSLTGYFRRNSKGDPLVSYYFDGEALDHIGSRDFWYDGEEDMIFAQIDLVLNEKSYEYVMETLPRIADDPQRGGFISLMIHEQYFHPDYRRHLPDFGSRVLDACAYLHSRGYVGSHISEITAE